MSSATREAGDPPERATPLGRPRDPALDRAILAAARRLLIEHGYHGMSLQGVARQAGVHMPAIYRRWRTKADLIISVVFPDELEPLELPGDLRGDVRVFVESSLREFADPATRAATPGLMGEALVDPEIFDRLEERQALFAQGLLWVVDEAVKRGELKRRQIKHLELLVPVLAGSAIFLEVRTKAPIDDALIDGLTDFLLGGLGVATNAKRR